MNEEGPKKLSTYVLSTPKKNRLSKATIVTLIIHYCVSIWRR